MNRSKDNHTLTKAEMEIMNIIWDFNKDGVTVRDVLEKSVEPKPAYTTVATFMKILTQKKFLNASKRAGDGKTLFFSPTISRDEYRSRVMDEVKDNFFGGSFSSLVSFFVREKGLSSDELHELQAIINSNSSFLIPHS